MDRITTPGKFEGEPIWAPTFWEHTMEGWHELFGNVYFVEIADVERERWPELEGYDFVTLYEDEQGFVHTGLATMEDREAAEEAEYVAELKDDDETQALDYGPSNEEAYYAQFIR